MQPFEKLGAFYLGQEYDLAEGERLDHLVMYDARDLTTHAVCVGMTGSGKTGLCVDLLEEAAIDSVPAIMIDPKGDLTNLLLTFPDLHPEDFEPWVNVDDARRKGMSVGEYARYIADTWRKGLADWGEGPERIRMLKESADFRIYTPGSDAGLPISIMASLRAPALSWDDNEELLREQIQGTVSALLGLVGVEADPLRSREHIFLSNVFEHFWRQGEDLDLARLITAIQSPPVRQLGVFDVDTFFPENDRFGLAMSLNNIIAAPSFGAWIKGEPLDVSSLLYTSAGKPRHSIFYIAHLSEPERMFFVTLLLEQIVTWVRQQSGTTSLRALLYFDEVFGFFPPVAEPPSKRPLLTLLKQARAFGFGVVLTTQNPVDLDYKGLTNAGTWFIGKLQTERDKMRVLDGLESVTAEAGGALDRRQLDRIISALDSRVFLLHNVHQDQPVIFQTRWAMSYLRGPLTRSQVRQLMAETRSEAASPAVAAAPARPAVHRDVAPAIAPVPAAVPDQLLGYSSTPPALPPDLPQVFLPLSLSPNRAIGRLEEELGQRLEAEETDLVYEPCLVALGRVSFVDRRRGVNESKEVGLLVQPGDVGAVIRWEDADPIEVAPNDLEDRPEPAALFGPVPSELNTTSELKDFGKDFSDYLYHEQALNLYHNPILKLYGQPGESERDFKIRAQQIAREKRDAEVEKLRSKYERKLDRLETRVAREERELAEDQAEYEARKREELLSAGESVIGLLGIFGRRSSTAVSKAARKRRMTTTAKADIEESEEEIARLQEEIEEMRQEMKEEATAITEKWAATLDEIETYPVKPRRSDVQVEVVALAWTPYWEIGYRSARGSLAHDRVPAWY
jgi:phage terminase Nu1 subunit (DNA packaging protein)